MNRRLLVLFAFFLAVRAAHAANPANIAEDRPLPALPYTPSLDPSVMDRSVDPCVDLYQFSCGKWLAQNPIPPDLSSSPPSPWPWPARRRRPPPPRRPP